MLFIKDILNDHQRTRNQMDKEKELKEEKLTMHQELLLSQGPKLAA